MIASKNGSLVPLLFIGLLQAAPASAVVVYSESFRSPTMPGVDGVDPCNTGPGGPGTYAFPSGWLLRNVDNRTPAANVAYVNEAWEVREDFNFALNNCVAFSTSWYSPAGAANDFMWSPAIAVPAGGATLSWKAVAYDPLFPDGYEVRVMPGTSGPPTGGTGVIGNQISGSTQVFTIAAENTAWTQRSVSLNAFEGQSVYVGFRNNSNDRFLLVIDDLSVANVAPDLAAQAPTAMLPYTRVPLALAYTPQLGVTVANLGGVALTNINGTAQLLRDAIALGATTPANQLSALAMGAAAPLTFSGSLAAISGLGTWSVRYTVVASEAEAGAAQLNNTIESANVMVTAAELARHEGASTGTLGIGAGNGGELGVQFTLPNQITFAGVRFAMAAHAEMVDDGMGGMRPSNWAGLSLVANLRNYDATNNKPGTTIIASTVAGTTVFSDAVYDLPFAGGPLELPAGTYVVTISEPIAAVPFPGDGVLTLPMHVTRFQLDTTWAIWPTAPSGDWTNFEDFGSSFAKTPAISLMTDLTLFKDGFEDFPPGAAPDRAVGSDGVGSSSVDAIRREAGTTLKLSDPSWR